MIYVGTGTVENVWSRKVWYLKIGKASMKLGSVFRRGSANIRRTKLNWPLVSPMKANLGRISQFH
jgi:hypothetical protein